MNKHLLIWEEVPENTKCYVFLDTDIDMIALCKAAHGYYVNAEDNEAVNKLNEALEEWNPEYSSMNNPRAPVIGPFVEVYISGFVM